MSLNKKLITIIFIVSLLLINFSACNKPQNPKLVVSEEKWYYGEVLPDNIVSHQFTLKNEGNDKLIIKSVYSSCACVSLELAEKEIPPGGETKLNAIFNPYGYEGYVTKYITIKSNDPNYPEKRIDLAITVLKVPNPNIEISTQTFNLGTISKEEQITLSFTIVNSGDAKLIIEDIVSEDIFSHNLNLPLILTPGEQYQAEIYLDASILKEGEFRKAVRIMTNDPKKPILFLRISGIRS